jgi:uncharacterized Zn finger protein
MSWGRSWDMWPAYVSVAEKKAKAKKVVDKLRQKKPNVMPVEIQGRKISSSFWGKLWCSHFDNMADYANRLPRGRSYVTHGAVCHLEIGEGRIFAQVSGTSLYQVEMKINPLTQDKWEAIKTKCKGQIGTMMELLQGKLSKEVMTVVSDPKEGLFPLSREISYKCSCPDVATMCKHVAAVFYGVGNRLDLSPELLFTLRGVDPTELLATGLDHLVSVGATEDTLEDAELADIFGVDLAESKSVTGLKDSPKKAKAGAAPQPIPAKEALKGRPKTTVLHPQPPKPEPKKPGRPPKAKPASVLEPVKAEPVKAEPIKPEPLKRGRPPKAQPAKVIEPIKPEPLKRGRPPKAQPAKVIKVIKPEPPKRGRPPKR